MLADYFFLVPLSAHGVTQDDVGVGCFVLSGLASSRGVGEFATSTGVLVGECSSPVFHTCSGKGQYTKYGTFESLRDTRQAWPITPYAVREVREQNSNTALSTYPDALRE